MKGRMRGYATRGETVAFGQFGSRRWKPAGSRPAARGVPRGDVARDEAQRQAVDARVPDKPIRRSRPRRAWARQGQSEGWVAVIKPARALRIEGVTLDIAKKAMALASAKLPITTRLIERRADGGREVTRPDA